MAKNAKILTESSGQTVLLPREFRLRGKEVYIRHYGRGILLEPKPVRRRVVGGKRRPKVVKPIAG